MKKTRLIIFNSPSNPTGMVYDRKEMEKIARVVEKHEGVFLISDEIYEDIIFTGEHVSMASFDFILDRVITVNEFQRICNDRLEDRIYWPPLWIARACNKLQGQFTSGVCSIAQRGQHWQPFRARENRKKFIESSFLRRRDLICGLLKR